MTDEVKHDLKRIAEAMRILVAAIDKLFLDVDKNKEEEDE